MIKPEKSPKIRKTPKNFPKSPKFPRKIPEKTLKICRLAALWRWGLSAAELGGVFSKKEFLRGEFGYTPLGHV